MADTLDDLVSRASQPAAIQSARRIKLLELPVPARDGTPVQVVIGSIPSAVFIRAYDGIPETDTGQREALARGEQSLSPAESRALMEAAAKTAAVIAEAGLIAPAFSFGAEPEDGKVHWPTLDDENQAAIINGITALSRKASPDAGEAGRAARFPGGGSGAGDGAVGTGPGEAGGSAPGAGA